MVIVLVLHVAEQSPKEPLREPIRDSWVLSDQRPCL